MNDPGPRGRHRGRDPEGREAAGGEAARGPRPGPARQGRGRLPGGGGHGGCGNPRPGAHRLRLLRPHGERSQGLPGGRRHRGSGRHGRGQGIGPLLLAKVVGTVVATRKDEGLTGTKLLVIQPLKTDHSPAGKPLVAVDSVGAGPGEEVFYVKGREASFPSSPPRCRPTPRSSGSWTIGAWPDAGRAGGREPGLDPEEREARGDEAAARPAPRPLGSSPGGRGARPRLGRRRGGRSRSARAGGQGGAAGPGPRHRGGGRGRGGGRRFRDPRGLTRWTTSASGSS